MFFSKDFTCIDQNDDTLHAQGNQEIRLVRTIYTGLKVQRFSETIQVPRYRINIRGLPSGFQMCRKS